METKIERFEVCDQCYSVGILYTDCVCSYGKHKTIKLDFEVCACCNHIITDGQPADTDFNNQQYNHNIKGNRPI